MLMTRKAMVAWGGNPAPEVAAIVDHGPGRRIVTWQEVMERRRKRQAERLEQIRRSERQYAYKLWVAYFNMNLMGGWHCFLETYHSRMFQRTWVDRDCRRMRTTLMETFPLLLPAGSDHLGPHWAPFDHWKVEFAATFARRQQHGEPLGVAYVWWDGHSNRLLEATL